MVITIGYVHTFFFNEVTFNCYLYITYGVSIEKQSVIQCYKQLSIYKQN